ncbi:MAG: hypothetical protein IJU48_00105 [Synergistaceae bacterium]|nr:hypothetical protein [Synergistaceae bacterium]
MGLKDILGPIISAPDVKAPEPEIPDVVKKVVGTIIDVEKTIVMTEDDD